ncbi:MAG TPA: hypothetical protein VHC18_22315 [Amycolatopsis sp.]|nr:hypothetical protein [Amycolatopsis sp.]
MLRALGHPASILGLLAGFVIGLFVIAGVQRLTARLLKVRLLPAERGVLAYLDPYGAVAAVLGGSGWPAAVTPVARTGWNDRNSKSRTNLVLLSGPIALAVVSAGLLAGFAASNDLWRLILHEIRLHDVISGMSGPNGQVFLLCAGLEAAVMALLALVPLPPLTGWALLVVNLKPTLNWQKTRMYAEERNIGVLVLLVLTVLPLGGSLPILLLIIDAIVHAILQAVAG